MINLLNSPKAAGWRVKKLKHYDPLQAGNTDEPVLLQLTDSNGDASHAISIYRGRIRAPRAPGGFGVFRALALVSR